MTARSLIDRYEQGFCRHVNAAHAIAFNNARTALLGILAAAGLGGEDEIVLAPLTCEVVPLALHSHPIKPVYADIAAGTLNLDPAALEAAHRPATRAVLFQHTYGTSSGLSESAAVARRHGLLLIEDCAQVMPTAADPGAPGRLGQAAIFSLNLVKPLPGGSGGMAVTDDPALAARIRTFRNRLPGRHALADALQRAEALVQRVMLNPTTYWDALALHRLLRGESDATLALSIARRIRGLATRISAQQARLGLRALAEAARIGRVREANCAWYGAELSDLTVAGIRDHPPAPWFYYPLLAPRKADLLRKARRRRIELVAWPDRTLLYGVDDVGLLARYGYTPGSCPVAEATAARLVGLPTGPDVAPRHRRRIARLVRECCL